MFTIVLCRNTARKETLHAWAIRRPAAQTAMAASQTFRVQTCVIGAGVVGLAIARQLALRGREVLVLEAARSFGTGTSSRNSEVIHAGIYYPYGSLKARTCVEGRQLLYRFCEDHGVNAQRVGKLIVATEPSEIPMLEHIASIARCNGVDGPAALRFLTREEVAEHEPEVRCVGALLSPATGIVDSHGMMLALLSDAESNGTDFSFGTRVCGARELPNGRLLIQTRNADEDLECDVECDEVVNAAGHGAPALARAMHNYSLIHSPTRSSTAAALVPTEYYAKGNYFSLTGPSPFRGLVYPVPQQAGLGVHATVDLAGRCRFGPDVEWVSGAEDLAVDPLRADAFYAEVRKYWPSLPDGALVPDYAGIRPKIQPPGQPNRDFALVGPKEHGVRGLVNLFGIESPGLTASLSLAQHVAEALSLGPLPEFENVRRTATVPRRHARPDGARITADL
jgi:L-2-hydroxyglutarate oxidase LhgO